MPEDTESQRLARARTLAFADFNRELGLRASKRQTQGLIGAYLDNPGEGRTALEGVFKGYPSQVQAKAQQLLEKYASGLQEVEVPRSEVENRKAEGQLLREYKNEIYPDTSANSWRDSEYIPRYQNNESVERLLKDKSELLKRRGEYIQMQAAQGNLEPYARHAQWLQRQGVLPGDAERVRGMADRWLSSSGFAEDVGKYDGYAHEAYSHAFPEKYLGVVDKSLGKAVSGADEARAVMIDGLIDVEAFESPSGSGVDPAIYQVAAPHSPTVTEGMRVAGLKSDANAEAEVLSEDFIARSKALGVKDAYGKDWNRGIALPREKEKNMYGEPMTIGERFEAAAKARYPGSDAESITDLYGKGLLPYARDVDKSDRLSLRRKAEAGLSELSRQDRLNPGAAGGKLRDLYGTLYENTFFHADPVSSAARGGLNLVRENMPGAAAGAALSAMNPEVATSVDRGDYAGAASVVAKDAALGAATEAAGRAVLPVAQRLAPAVVRAAAPLARAAGPIAVGAALFGQGQSGSLTDVLTRKASQHIPGLKSNPKTDLGRKAGNELMYVFNSLRSGRLPYSR